MYCRMPYKIRKAPGKELYWVVAQDGRHMSKDPIPLARAKRQIIALNISEHSGKPGKK